MRLTQQKRRGWFLPTLALALCPGLSASADTLTWTGKNSSEWNGAGNWTDADGAAATFTTGADVMFGDTAATKTVTLPGTDVTAGNIVFDNDADYTLESTSLKTVTSFTKQGSGKLTVSGKHAFAAPVEVKAGELLATGDKNDNTATGIGHPRTAHVVTVWTNGVLTLPDNGCLGSGTATTAPKVELDIIGGTLTLGSKDVKAHGTVGNLWLHNATLNLPGKANGIWQPLGLQGDWIKFTGDSGRGVTISSVDASTGINIGRLVQTEIYVDDLTQSATDDVTLSCPIRSAVHTDGKDYYAKGFRKTGPGTLYFAAASTNGTFIGDIDIAEGTVRVGGAVGGKIDVTYSALGHTETNRTITVRDGASLVLNNSNIFGQNNKPVLAGIVVSNATLSLKTGANCGIGPLKLYDATMVYSGGGMNSSSTKATWGSYALHGTVTVDGTKPCVLPQVGGIGNVFSLGYSTGWAITDVTATSSNYVGYTTFDVADITKDGRPDFILGVPLQNIYAWNNASNTRFPGVSYKTGVLKTGAGTMEIASSTSTYTYGTRVDEGTLLVGGALTTSAVTVNAGAYLGGTGTVASVTLADGAGLTAFSTQTAPLAVTSLSLASGGAFAVRLVHDGDGDLVSCKVPVVTSAGLASAFNAAAWTVAVADADADTHYRCTLTADGDTLYATAVVGGLVISIR